MNKYLLIRHLVIKTQRGKELTIVTKEFITAKSYSLNKDNTVINFSKNENHSFGFDISKYYKKWFLKELN